MAAAQVVMVYINVADVIVPVGITHHFGMVRNVRESICRSATCTEPIAKLRLNPGLYVPGFFNSIAKRLLFFQFD